MYLVNMKFLYLLPLFVYFSMEDFVYDPVKMECVEASKQKFATYYDDYDDYGFDNKSPLEGGYFEGDMILNWTSTKNGLISTFKRWKGGIIPYVIDKGFTYKQLKMIFDAIETIHSLTCVRFVTPSNLNEIYVRIQKVEGYTCSSTVGVDFQPLCTVKFSNRCFDYIGTLLHEFMHTMGFLHEQSRPDRDKYIKIHCENILPRHIFNFDAYNNKILTTFGFEYDYGSVMQYSEYAFSKNGKKTMEFLKPALDYQEPKLKYSKIDVMKINAMYNCENGRSYTDNFDENVLFIPYRN